MRRAAPCHPEWRLPSYTSPAFLRERRPSRQSDEAGEGAACRPTHRLTLPLLSFLASLGIPDPGSLVARLTRDDTKPLRPISLHRPLRPLFLPARSAHPSRCFLLPPFRAPFLFSHSRSAHLLSTR